MFPQWVIDELTRKENREIIFSIPKGYQDKARIRELTHDHVLWVG